MKLFSRLYEMSMRWAAHRHAPRYLAGLSFAESSFFPIPPDVMLAPMSLARPHRAWAYALLTTIASVLGGMLGYLIGLYAIDWVMPLIEQAGYLPAYEQAGAWFDRWGLWVIFLAGFSPIPYKLFTISAGAIGMAFAPFVIASAVGRGARFFLVSGVMVWGGERMQRILRDYIDRVGWVLLLLAVLAYVTLNNGH